jgi:uncharacterized protein (DUF1330 family)
MSVPAYLIGDVTAKDPMAYERYRNEVSELIARHRGEYLVRGGEIEVVAGDWRPNRLIILKFPDKAAVRAYLNDPVFHKLSELRQQALTSQVVMVEGVEPITAGATGRML